jgi:rubrerythrin
VFWGAISREKESIVFYLGLKGLVPENLGRNKIYDIIREEMKHLRLLSNKLASLKA